MVEAIPFLLLIMIVMVPMACLYTMCIKLKMELRRSFERNRRDREDLLIQVDSMLSSEKSHKSWEDALQDAQRAEDSLLSKVKNEYFGG